MTTKARTAPEPVQPETTPAGEPAPDPGPEPSTPVRPETETLGLAETDEEHVQRLVDEAVARLPRSPFGFLSTPRLAPVADRDEYPLTVHEAIAEVTRQIGAIEKTGRSTEGYRFRGIDQALAALHPILGNVGLVIIPGDVLREQWETRATAKGGTLNVARLLVRYTFIGPDGTKLRAAAWGEGADSGDKATQKAHSQSYKTLVFQAFTIPTEASADDEPDATNDAARPFTAEEQERAQTAWQAALNAPDLGSLVGVRRRAEHLLLVPVDATGDGTVAPLSYWLDRRRTELEGVQP